MARSDGGREWVVPAIVAAIFLAAPAAADRHCAPALERYYGARHAILTPGPSVGGGCEATVVESISRLKEAAKAARDCGCGSLEDGIDDLIDRAGTDMSCQSRAVGV
ncbi:MAG: hypothetical protein HKM95_18325, partial [Inquilinus sp.]|nr:hypothetical protein [Inquilinus sp.]